jgi:hypothetical protein
MRRWFPIAVFMLVLLMVGMLAWVSNLLDSRPVASPPPGGKSQTTPQIPANPTAAESLLAGYGDPATPPIEDLRKIHRVATGYFSVVKDSTRFPIGGNEDLAAALRGENPNREVFVRPGSPVFSADGRLVDRWGSPLIVHPEAWRQLELRSAGPDRIPYNGDDLILAPNGVSQAGN